MDLFVLRAVLGLDKSEYEQGIDDAKKSGSGAGKAIVGALTAATKAATTFAGTSVKAGMDFDASMSNVAAISGATGADLADLRDKAQEMGASTKFSATEAADAFSYMAMAGWKTEDMLNGIEGVMYLAAASGEDLATTSDIVTDAMTAFGLAADGSTNGVANATHFADVLAAASSNANTNVSLMGETFKYVAPVAGALGYSAEDTAEATGLLANAGIKGSQAGTSLRAIITRLSTDAGASSKSLGALGTLTEKLGVQFYNTDGSARDLNDVISEARVAWQGLTEEQQANYGKTIAGQEGLSAWLALMNAAPSDIAKLSSAIDECDGAAERMANTMQDNLAGDITIFKSAMEGAQIVISDQLTPTLRDFVQFGTNAVSTLSTAFKDGGLDGAMAALSTILTEGLNMVIGKLPEMVNAGVQLLGAIGTGIIQNLPALAEAAVQIIGMLGQYLAENIPWLMTTITEMVTQIAMMLTDPGNTGTLIDAAMGIIQALADGLLESLPVLIESLPTIIENMVQSITENAPKLIETGVAIITALVQGITENLPTLLEKIPEMIASLLGAILENAPRLLEGAAQIVLTLAEGLIKSLPTLVAKIPEIIGSIVTSITEHAPDVAGAAGTLIGAMLTGFTEAFPALLKGVGDLMGSLVGGIKDALSGALDWGKDLCDNFAQGISDGWSTVKGGVLDFAGGIRDFLGFSEPKEGPLSDFHTFAPDMMALFAQGIRENVGIVTSAIAEAFDISAQMGEIFDQMLTGLTDALGAMSVEMVQNLSSGILDALNQNNSMENVGEFAALSVALGMQNVAQTVNDAGIALAGALSWSVLNEFDHSHSMENAGEFAALSMAEGLDNESDTVLKTGMTIVTNLVKNVTDNGHNMLNAAQTLMKDMDGGIMNGAPDVTETLSELLGQINWMLNDFSSWGHNWGEDMMASFANGIYSGFRYVQSAVNSVTAWMRSNLHFSKPDQGPLSDFHTYAPDMMELFAEGVRDNARMVQAEIDRAFDFGGAIVSSHPQMPVMTPAWNQESFTQFQNNRPIEIVVKLADGTELGRAIHRMYDDEDRRLGKRIANGAY